MKNWKTSLSGIASIIGGVALYINHPDQLEAAFGMVSIGFGLLFAKDHNVSGKEDEPIDGGGLPNPPKKP